MSGGRFSVEAIFKAVDKMSAPVAKMSSRIDRMTSGAARGIVKLDSAMRGMRGGMMQIGAGFGVVGVGAGVAALDMITAGAQFEQAITAVGAVSLMTRGQIAELEKQALELGATTKFSATEVAQGMELMGRAGFTNAEILSGMPGVLSAAAAEGAELAVTAGNISNVLKGMGLATSQTTRVADVLTLASARTNSSISSLGESMANVASTARQFKVPFEDTVAAVALLQDVGLDASEAGSAVNTMLTQLAAPSDKARAKMRALGVTFQDAAGNMLPLSQVFSSFEKAAKKSGGNMKQVAFFAELVGLRGQKAALNLKDMFASGKFGALVAELQKAEQMGDGQGAAKMMAGLRIDNLLGDWETFTGAIEGVKIELFNMESGPLRGVVQGWTQWVDANRGLITSELTGFLADLRTSLPNIASNMRDVGSGAYDLFKTVRDNLPTITKWGERIGAVVIASYALSGAIKAVQIWMVGYQGVMAAVTWVTTAGTIGNGAYTASLAVMRIAAISAGHGLGVMQGALNASAMGTAVNGVTSTLGKAGLLGAALGVGYAIGTWADNTFHFSDKIADLLADITGVNDALNEGGGRAKTRGIGYTQTSPALPASMIAPAFNMEADAASAPRFTPQLVTDGQANAREIANELAVQLESRQSLDVNVSADPGTKAKVTNSGERKGRRVSLPSSGRQR